MIELTLTGVRVAVADLPDGTKMFRAQDQQSGIAVNIPLDPAAAKTIAAGLTGIEIARSLPGLNGKPTH